jgi:hypothetical protein
MGQLSESTAHPAINFISITSWQQKFAKQMDEYVQALTEVLLNLMKG